MNMASDTETAAAGMTVVSLPLVMIDRSKRLRPVDPALAQTIAESIRERGQLTPVLVRTAGEDGLYRLIAGEHRCEAHEINGDKFILAVICDVHDDEARLMEIDENLAHADLNDLDKAIFLGERKKIYEQRYPQTRHGKASKKDKVADSATILRFTLTAAQLMKQSERTIRALVHRYNNITPPVLQRLRGTWIAQVGAQLDLIASLPAHEQMAVVETMLRDVDAQPTVSAALVEVRGIRQKPRDDADVQYERLVAAWRKAGATARRRFDTFRNSPEGKKAGA